MIRAVTITAVAALAACAPSRETATEVALSVASQQTFTCGNETVTITPDGDFLRMTSGGVTWRLVPTRAASGARYVATGDTTTMFWNKGDTAQVSLVGRNLPECTRQQPKPYIARGQEPGWRLDISEGRAVLLAEYGERRVETLLPPPQVSGAVTLYSAPSAGLAISISKRLCEDTATGMPHPDTVSVTLEGNTYNGCGGDPMSLLYGDEWVVEDINGAGIVDGSRATIAFREDGSMGGRGSCNTWRSGYTLTGEGLTSDGRAASTMMACAEVLIEQERRLLDTVTAMERFSISDTGALVIHAASGHSITARR